MAEFQEVIKHWHRMCTAFDGDCDKCQIEGSPCQYIAFLPDDLKYIEEPIMAWAAEHQEPVYPTWYRWLTMMGAVTSSDDLWMDLQQTIPADIAEKLGVEPKEG